MPKGYSETVKRRWINNAIANRKKRQKDKQ
jgi:hypothetical protein